MKLIPPDEIPKQGIRRIYRNYSWLGLLGVTAIMGAITAYVAIPKGTPTNPVLIVLPGLATLLFLVLTLLKLRVALRSSNWLLCEAEQGLYVNLRSYMNYHLPPEDKTVLFIPKEAVAAIGKTEEVRRSQDRFPHIDIYLQDAPPPEVREALYTERRREGATGFLGRGKHHDYPVRVIDPPAIRLVWDWIRPKEQRALDLLGETYPIAPDRTTQQPDWNTMNDEQKEAAIAELWETGHVDDAVRLYRQMHSMSERNARKQLRERFGGG